MVQILAIIIGLAVAGLGGYALYDAFYVPPTVVLKYGKTIARSEMVPGITAEVRTRQVQRGKLTFWQVELPGGSWLDCDDDCAQAYRREILDPQQVRKEESR